MQFFLITLVLLVLVAPAVLLLTIYYGWVLSILWSWFAVETFGAPALSLWQAAGLMLLVSFFHRDILLAITSKKLEDKQHVLLIGLTTGPLFTLLIGWLLHFFV